MGTRSHYGYKITLVGVPAVSPEVVSKAELMMKRFDDCRMMEDVLGKEIAKVNQRLAESRSEMGA
eukprot:gene14549-20590_t